MTTDLREQGTRIRQEPDRPGRLERGGRWPVIATGIVLVVLTAVAVLVLTQGRSQPVSDSDRWAAGVEGMMTDVREGSGYAPGAEAVSVAHPHGLENPGAYARTWDLGTYPKGALTESREGPGYEPVLPRGPVGSVGYAAGALTEIREG